jgi:hypothetical protein
MPQPIVFFSYARKDTDRYLENFFTDLCHEIAILSGQDEDQLRFRDKSSLPLMEPWDDNVVAALQSCTVMVCVATVRYFNREVCGKEYRLFDLKRKQRLPDGQDVPAVILPVVWAPCDLPPFMQDLQLVPKEVSDSYLEKGLRHFARFDERSYGRCTEAFAASIVKTWKKHKNIKPLDKVPDFENIPNAFAAGKWEEALGPDGGFLAGPEVANFIFAAESRDESPQPAGRYGTTGSAWRPFFPTEPETALDHAAKGLKKRFRFREILFGETFRSDLEQAKKRKNLSILIGEPRALALESFKEASAFQDLWWEGFSVLLPCHQSVARCSDQDAAFQSKFPVISQVALSPRTPAELQDSLDRVLTKMSQAVVQPAIDAREKKNPPPPGLSGAGDARG